MDFIYYNLTLTRVVFEFKLVPTDTLCFFNLTLTRVVFELIIMYKED